MRHLNPVPVMAWIISSPPLSRRGCCRRRMVAACCGGIGGTHAATAAAAAAAAAVLSRSGCASQQVIHTRSLDEPPAELRNAGMERTQRFAGVCMFANEQRTPGNVEHLLRVDAADARYAGAAGARALAPSSPWALCWACNEADGQARCRAPCTHAQPLPTVHAHACVGPPPGRGMRRERLCLAPWS